MDRRKLEECFSSFITELYDIIGQNNMYVSFFWVYKDYVHIFNTMDSINRTRTTCTLSLAQFNLHGFFPDNCLVLRKEIESFALINKTWTEQAYDPNLANYEGFFNSSLRINKKKNKVLFYFYDELRDERSLETNLYFTANPFLIKMFFKFRVNFYYKEYSDIIKAKGGTI